MVFDSRPILVALDGSTNAEAAIAPALLLGRKLNAPVHFIHVAEPGEVEGEIDLESMRVSFADYVRELLNEDEPAAGTDTSVVAGSAPLGVLEAAASKQAVFVASHGRGGLKAALIGSVADKIVRGATVPTFVIPSTAEARFGAGPVLIGLDGSATAERGLALGRELAALFDTPVALVRAFNLPAAEGVQFIGYPVETYEAIQQAADAYLSEAKLPGETVFSILAPPVDAIEQAAATCGAGLVVLTSHGKNFAWRIALGSVTDRTMHRLKRPILIVPVGS